MSYLYDDYNLNQLLLINDNLDTIIGARPAANNVVRGQAGFPAGYRPFDQWYDHGDNNAHFGSNGNFAFTLPNRTGMGVHSGQHDNVRHPTFGCIRTTDQGTGSIYDLHFGVDQSPDPVRGIYVVR